MSMHILITGARAPVSVEWARLALRSGHKVWLADSFHLPIGRFLDGIEGYIRLPSPCDEPKAYSQAVLQAITDGSIDWLVPTCEEIFHLASFREQLTQQVDCFLPENGLLFGLHDKFRAMELLQDLGSVQVPDTRLCTSIQQIEPDPETILKPAYSRFGSQVIRNPQAEQIPESAIGPQHPWVQQQKLRGRTLCNFALLNQGEVMAHQAYRPRYCLNGSAATFFEPVFDPRLEYFIQQFGARTGYHGQVAFDFIEQEDVLYVIECNPRTTSGFHLLGPYLTLDAADKLQQIACATGPYRVGAALPLFFGVNALIHGQLGPLKKDYSRAKDVLIDEAVPLGWHGQWCALGEMMVRCLVGWQRFSVASTRDIEWNQPVQPAARHGSR